MDRAVASNAAVYGPGEDTHRWPREVVVDHHDGTVSLLADIAIVDGENVRARRAGDIIRRHD